ncbi:putative lipoLpqN family protein [Mycobacterium xenopi 4042]|uniref:Putative lipoLpqN family protein n=1 Tax=Mycobacterium xenopi 4042 TaxID=1299334 RepID=X7YI40_MYCXE|nr:putative lipoLpqN family protein [Mycobacterium xenopi 4042]
MTWRLCAAICSAFLAGGCSNTTGGIAIPVPTSSTTAVLHQPPSDPLADVPGVETTLPDHIPPDALVCFPPPSVVGRPATATVSDPAAPKITINVPDGWTSTAGDGDVAMVLAGPDGMTGRVTIASTSLTPAAALAHYDAMARSAAGAEVTITAAPFCGYSSQQLAGTYRGPSGAIAFADRIAHIWTNTKSYLVAIHQEGPAGLLGFDAAKIALMADFAVVIP